MRRRLISAIAAVIFVALPALHTGTAHADGTGDAFNDGSGVGAEAGDSGSTDGGGSTSGGGTPVCTYHKLSDEDAAIADQMAENGWGSPKGSGAGSWYRKICTNPDGSSVATVIWISVRVDPAVLAETAYDRTPVPLPAARLNPPEGRDQVVNLATWMWIEPSQWRPVSATASAGGVTVTATATPQSVAWDMGNGDVVVCNGPGTPYDSQRPARDQRTDCSYTYQRSSARADGGTFTVRATTTWAVTWTVVGAGGGGSLGTATRTTSFQVRVAEIQAVNQ